MRKYISLILLFSIISCKSSMLPAQRYAQEHRHREFSYYGDWKTYWKVWQKGQNKPVKGPIKNKQN